MVTNSLAGLLYYMRERESIRVRRDRGQPPPWTDDVILRRYRFTNVRRADDRTTRAFKAVYQQNYRPGREAELLYNCGVARYFGTVAMYTALGWQTAHRGSRMEAVARRLKREGKRVYTAAYMITTGGLSEPKEVTIERRLRTLRLNAGAVVEAMERARTWRAGVEALRELDGFKGTGFMAKEILQDFMMVAQMEWRDAASWSPVGVGGRRGLNRLHGRPVNWTSHEEGWETELVDAWRLVQPWAQQHLRLDLTAHDVQFNLCEFDKYERARLGQGRPKQTYRPREE